MFIKQLRFTAWKTLVDGDFEILKKEFPDNWEYLNKNLAYPFEYFNCINDYKKISWRFKEGDFFSKLKIYYPADKEIERTKETINIFNIKNGEELIKLFLKSDVVLLADVLEKFIKVSFNEFDINHLYCISLPCYTWQWGLKYADTKKRNTSRKRHDSITWE